MIRFLAIGATAGLLLCLGLLLVVMSDTWAMRLTLVFLSLWVVARLLRAIR